jgi:hypothetical protein
MNKVLVEKCTPQQARVEIKTQLKPANKPKVKEPYIVYFHAVDHI